MIVSFIFLLSCGNIEVYNPNIYSENSKYFMSSPPLSPSFKICTDYFTADANIEYEANLLCSNENKIAQFINKDYIGSCYLLIPIAYIYKCI